MDEPSDGPAALVNIAKLTKTCLSFLEHVQLGPDFAIGYERHQLNLDIIVNRIQRWAASIGPGSGTYFPIMTGSGVHQRFVEAERQLDGIQDEAVLETLIEAARPIDIDLHKAAVQILRRIREEPKITDATAVGPWDLLRRAAKLPTQPSPTMRRHSLSPGKVTPDYISPAKQSSVSAATSQVTSPSTGSVGYETALAAAEAREWIDAIWEGDVFRVGLLVSYGIDVNELVTYTLHDGQLVHDFDLLQDSGAFPDPAVSEVRQEAPIMMAASFSCEVTIQLSVFGADVNFRLPGGPTTLQSLLGNLDIDMHPWVVSDLLALGADVNAAPGPNGNALRIAVREREVHIVQLLLDAGADVNHVDEGDGDTALSEAIWSRKRATVRMLLSNGANPDVVHGGDCPPTTYSPLWHAVSVNDAEIVSQLLEAGANTNRGIPTGESLVAIASVNRNLDIVKLLVNAGADINALDTLAGPPVIAAAVVGCADIAEWLLGHGANISLAKVWWDQTNAHDRKGGHAVDTTASANVLNIVLPLPLPEVLGPWQLAAATTKFGTLDSLMTELQTDGLTPRLHATSWQWKLPEFIQSCYEGEDGASKLNLDDEVVLTTTEGAPGLQTFSLQHKGGVTRAYTWASLISTLASEATHFIECLVRHVADHLQGLSESQSYKYTSPDTRLSARVSYDRNHLGVHFTDNISNPSYSNLARGLEVLCKALRPMKDHHSSSLSTSRWRLERYEIPVSDDPTTASEETTTTYGLRPSMFLTSNPLPAELGRHACWQHLFDMGFSTIVNLDERFHPPRSPMGEGLEMPFELMVALSAVEFPLVVDGGVVLIGYQTVLVPVKTVGDMAQFHLITCSKGQINPHAMDLGVRMKTQDFHQFKEKRCFLGWCQFAVINLGTSELPAATVNYSGGRERGRSLHLDGYTVLAQMGASEPLSAILGFQANFRYTSHRRQFTPVGSYQMLLRDTAQELAIVYDSGDKRCWLVPKLSLLLHMCQAYTMGASGATMPFVDRHADAAPLFDTLSSRGDDPIFYTEPGDLVFRQLLLGLNINLRDTVGALRKSSGKKLYGFEFMDVVMSPGRGACMKELPISSLVKSWLHIVKAVDAVVVCSDIGAAISARSNCDESLDRNNPACNTLPPGLDYLAATIPCLGRLAQRQKSSFYGEQGGSRVGISEGTFLDISGDPFTPCPHNADSGEDCWGRVGLMQCLVTPSYFNLEFLYRRFINRDPSRIIPESGAIAFGGVPS